MRTSRRGKRILQLTRGTVAAIGQQNDDLTIPSPVHMKHQSEATVQWGLAHSRTVLHIYVQ